LDVRAAVFFMIARRARDVPTVLLGALAFLAPFAIDVSLPGLPEIGAALRAPGGVMQWTLSAYVLATGIGQLIWGPISDRYGRRPVIVIGLALYAASAFGCALASGVMALILLRFVQGIGACAGLVCATAIIQDLPLRPEVRVARQALIGVVINVGPLLAPVAGVAILTLLGWHGLYAVPALLAVAMLAIIVVVLPETAERTASTVLERYRRALAYPRTIPFALMIFAVFGGYFAMIGGSPFALVEQHHLTTSQFAEAFTLEALCALGGSFVTSRVAQRWSAPSLLAGSIALALAAGLANGVTGLLGAGPAAFIATMSVYAFAFGIMLPSAFSLALADAGSDAGVMSGILGAAISFGGAAGGTISGALPFAPTIRIGIVVAIAACAAAVFHRTAPLGSPAAGARENGSA
jgi:DHA1 family bicyclomycin/chloramphenicol resistance-like MFS transporter